jgi:hypothetical protein
MWPWLPRQNDQTHEYCVCGIGFFSENSEHRPGMFPRSCGASDFSFNMRVPDHRGTIGLFFGIHNQCMRKSTKESAPASQAGAVPDGVVSIVNLKRHILSVLKQRIANGNFTERGLARRAGLSQTHVHHILSGKRAGTDDAIEKLTIAGRVYASGDVRNDFDPSAWWAMNSPSARRTSEPAEAAER